MMKIDCYTVETLQLLGPGVSRKDERTARGLILGGEVFANFSDAERLSIWEKLREKDAIILLLYTFFQDIYYLEECANCVKRLISLDKHQPTVRSAMLSTFISRDLAS
jgi:hypothetical protein